MLPWTTAPHRRMLSLLKTWNAFRSNLTNAGASFTARFLIRSWMRESQRVGEIDSVVDSVANIEDFGPEAADSDEQPRRLRRIESGSRYRAVSGRGMSRAGRAL